MKKGLKLDKLPYKGVRDFYPEDAYLENFVFSKMRDVAERFGYSEYFASPLEPAELYKAKTGEEIVREQTYTFTDRGGREVTLRPEMTPTVARMVAAKRRDLAMPIRWYSIPNLFRYEQPQKGRLREHFQLNVDMFGVETLDAEVEMISVASEIMKNFGAKNSDFEIRINSRELMNDLFKSFSLSKKEIATLSKIIDKKEKISKDVFEVSVEEVLGEKAKDFIYTISVNQRITERLGEKNKNVKTIESLIDELSNLGIDNVFFTPTLMRGFDYYTDIIFEIFDTNKDNRRSLFGGGRYDGLLEIFGENPIAAIGFGMGDVTIIDFLRARDLLPEYKSKTELYVCRATGVNKDKIMLLANRLRSSGLNVAVDLTNRKLGDQIKAADKMKIPFIVCVGEEELSKKSFKVKDLRTGKEVEVGEDEILKTIRS